MYIFTKKNYTIPIQASHASRFRWSYQVMIFKLCSNFQTSPSRFSQAKDFDLAINACPIGLFLILTRSTSHFDSTVASSRLSQLGISVGPMDMLIYMTCLFFLYSCLLTLILMLPTASFVDVQLCVLACFSFYFIIVPYFVVG